jgi:cobalt-zinc-cadmium resistance protein CzcA
MIPLSLPRTFIGLRLRGFPPTCCAGAMDFGIIVDGAVIVVENVFWTLAERKTAGETGKQSVRPPF